MAVEESLAHIEFETKYRVEDHLLIEFKQIVENLQADIQFRKNQDGGEFFIYVEGPDRFFTYPDGWFDFNKKWDTTGTFIRYRKPSHGLDKGRRQVTWKYKPKGASNNVKRKEHNWDVAGTPEKTIIEQIQDSGATYNFEIVKNCHIYRFEDATVVFYTVYDTTDGKVKKADSFVEIEVCEETIHNLSEDQAWEVIRKYEKALLPLGINAQKRMDKSLFEIYRR